MNNNEVMLAQRLLEIVRHPEDLPLFFDNHVENERDWIPQTLLFRICAALLREAQKEINETT
jgi:hypothetical protein